MHFGLETLFHSLNTLLVCVFYLFTAPVQLFNQPFVRPSVRSFIRSYVRSFVGSFVRLFVLSFVPPFVRSLGFQQLPIFMFYFFSLGSQENSSPNGDHNKVHYSTSFFKKS